MTGNIQALLPAMSTEGAAPWRDKSGSGSANGLAGILQQRHAGRFRTKTSAMSGEDRIGVSARENRRTGSLPAFELQQPQLTPVSTAVHLETAM